MINLRLIIKKNCVNTPKLPKFSAEIFVDKKCEGVIVNKEEMTVSVIECNHNNNR